MIYKTNLQSIYPYLKDGSNYSKGSADKVIIPESIDELVIFLKNNRCPITISGAGTGMTASRIPESGYIIGYAERNNGDYNIAVYKNGDFIE